MKIDKRLSEEFGAPLPSPSYPPTGGIVEWLVGHIVPFMLSMALLALGSLIGRHYPVAVWWFFGAAGAAALCIMAMFCLVLFVMEAGHQEDSPDE